ncbi:outer membrane protein [Candidatus Nucleicultrix amoebiphila]|jgi:opacity protein-like surface antigen|uniref:Outer membrane protein beta-barrel domain-containing protein n=1 Tax=Candidatus Nucleicultrix amoebiphila FS5 TaxID=1414854 RepID=A0A1W6N3C4_9PROT|nr:outer membrane beta-barrel protein [Candidatus Nucleicultrix amoebiphila]ARN84345.1 hypothetical protein GQ61_02265 [Candidatus Nucleicultrix amoebiphila FS5]
MKRIFTVSILLGILAIVPAEAKYAKAKPKESMIRSGFKFGFGAGYGWSKAVIATTQSALGISRTRSIDLAGEGALGRVFIGYDHINKSGFMIGFEMGGEFSNINGTTQPETALLIENVSLKTENTFDIALRLGYAVKKAFIPYFKFGMDNTSFKMSNRYSIGQLVNNEVKKRLTGIVAGVGAEVPVSTSISLGAEYSYSYFLAKIVNTQRDPANPTQTFQTNNTRPRINKIVARMMVKI